MPNILIILKYSIISYIFSYTIKKSFKSELHEYLLKTLKSCKIF